MQNWQEEARNETCDLLGREITDAEWDEAAQAAQQKLDHIINHYGDDNGDRRQPWYCGALACEYLHARALAAFCALQSAKKKAASEESGPLTINSISHAFA